LTPNDVEKDVFADMTVYSAQRVIQQVGVSVTVHSTGQAYTLLLTSAKVDALGK
jgi:hypothetical protein